MCTERAMYVSLKMCRRYPAESRQAVTALVRALLLRAPDRADARAAAIASAQELVSYGAQGRCCSQSHRHMPGQRMHNAWLC
jgi:hypothetical protein